MRRSRLRAGCSLVTKILPDTAPLLRGPLVRRHAPVVRAEHDRAYEQFRRCLRWELAFSCPFCLVHEAQVAPRGIVRTGLYWIEHLEPQATHPDLRNVYTNVVYVCRQCNVARGGQPRLDDGGRVLLDPHAAIWAAHFAYDGDELVPLTPDARYTAETYDINAPGKVRARSDRREAITEAVDVLTQVPSLIREMMRSLDLQPTGEQRLRLEIVDRLYQSLAKARRVLLQLAAVPVDADAACACGGAGELPPLVDTTLWHVDFAAGRE